MASCPFLALTAAFGSAVASTIAKVLAPGWDGRYLTDRPVVRGYVFHALVMAAAQTLLSAYVFIMAGVGLSTTTSLHSAECRKNASTLEVWRNRERGSCIISSHPTTAWKGASANYLAEPFPFQRASYREGKVEEDG